ncbi:hypothetical protein L6452_29610 [Arctium lappa]|uniref:Uncharacterized protein n=1 Tax=Arctium lappa TaxID=4217 RepID=A0ACB8ZHZ5_ARCLA|nr:hypothetical protein L6452_29610 [Arctium lappa]
MPYTATIIRTQHTALVSLLAHFIRQLLELISPSFQSLKFIDFTVFFLLKNPKLGVLFVLASIIPVGQS